MESLKNCLGKCGFLVTGRVCARCEVKYLEACYALPAYVVSLPIEVEYTSQGIERLNDALNNL